jgi:hypothetical protein
MGFVMAGGVDGHATRKGFGTQMVRPIQVSCTHLYRSNGEQAPSGSRPELGIQTAGVESGSATF